MSLPASLTQWSTITKRYNSNGRVDDNDIVARPTIDSYSQPPVIFLLLVVMSSTLTPKAIGRSVDKWSRWELLSALLR